MVEGTCGGGKVGVRQMDVSLTSGNAQIGREAVDSCTTEYAVAGRHLDIRRCMTDSDRQK